MVRIRSAKIQLRRKFARTKGIESHFTPAAAMEPGSGQRHEKYDVV